MCLPVVVVLLVLVLVLVLGLEPVLVSDLVLVHIFAASPASACNICKFSLDCPRRPAKLAFPPVSPVATCPRRYLKYGRTLRATRRSKYINNVNIPTYLPSWARPVNKTLTTQSVADLASVRKLKPRRRRKTWRVPRPEIKTLNHPLEN